MFLFPVSIDNTDTRHFATEALSFFRILITVFKDSLSYMELETNKIISLETPGGELLMKPPKNPDPDPEKGFPCFCGIKCQMNSDPHTSPCDRQTQLYPVTLFLKPSKASE